MLSRFVSFVLVAATASPAAAQAQPAGSLLIPVEHHTTFSFAGEALRVWKGLQPTGLESSRKYVYDPVFLPEVTARGAVNVHLAPFGDKVLVRLPILVGPAEARRRATRAARASDGLSAVRATDVTVFPITKLSVQIPHLVDLPYADKVAFKSQSFDLKAKLPTTVDLMFLADDQATAKRLKKDLTQMVVKFAFVYDAKFARRNYASVKLSALKKTRLYADLRGEGRDVVYVSRWDFRRLMESVDWHSMVGAVIEDAEQFSEEHVDRLLELLKARYSDVSAFDQQKLARTDRREDLNPTRIEKLLNDALHIDQGKVHVKETHKGAVDGSFLFGLFSGKASGSVTTDDLREWLRKQHIKHEFTGQGWKVKSVDVTEINLSSFDQDVELTDLRTYLSSNKVPERAGQIDIGRLVRNASAYPGLDARVSRLERLVTPVGSVVAYAGQELPSDAWMVCDGRALKREDYPDLYAVLRTAHGSGYDKADQTKIADFNLPDLRGRFVRMVDRNSRRDPDAAKRAAPRKNGADGNSGDNVGSIQEDEVKEHDHDYAIYEKDHDDDDADGGGRAFIKKNKSGKKTGRTGGSESRPKNIALYYIIKVMGGATKRPWPAEAAGTRKK